MSHHSDEESVQAISSPFFILKCLFELIFLVSSFPEASKIVMRYVAAVSGHGDKVGEIKEQLLQSNPVLEGS